MPYTPTNSACSPLPNARAIVDALAGERLSEATQGIRTEKFFRRIEKRTADDPRGEQSQAPGIREAVLTGGGRGFISGDGRSPN